jgi:hypothetical protein
LFSLDNIITAVMRKRCCPLGGRRAVCAHFSERSHHTNDAILTLATERYHER